MRAKQKSGQWIERLASLRITVPALLMLFVLVAWGTVYQVDHGLFAAQEKFFGSWFFLAGGFFPVPGGQMVLGVLFVNLFAATLVRMPLGFRQAGLITIHAGLLLLLAGGLVTKLVARESVLMLFEGEASNVSSSWNDWEFSFWTERDGLAEDQGRDVLGVRSSALKPGVPVQVTEKGPTLVVKNWMPNARALGVPEQPDRVIKLEPIPADKEPFNNTAGAEVSVVCGSGGPSEFLLYGNKQTADTFSCGDTKWKIQLRRERTELPVVVELVDFEKQMHPGSEIAASYSSLVRVESPAGVREVHIRMNEPFRYRGFTVFQNAFQEHPDGRVQSVFAVVRNHGRLIPYAASIMVFIGLSLHFIVEVIARRPARRKT